MKHLLLYTTVLLLMFSISCQGDKHAQKPRHHKTPKMPGCGCDGLGHLSAHIPIDRLNKN
jgi:hypothetical protein